MISFKPIIDYHDFDIFSEEVMLSPYRHDAEVAWRFVRVPIATILLFKETKNVENYRSAVVMNRVIMTRQQMLLQCSTVGTSTRHSSEDTCD
jgi:hypothetical protein